MDALIAEYLNVKKDRLADIYVWKFVVDRPKELFSVEVQGNSWLDKTRNLKEGLRRKIKSDNSDTSLARIATYFIKEWGGIRGFSKADEVVKMFRCVADTEKMPQDFTPKFQSVSSWSKWASLVYPKWACIYDARVAYSINAINYINGSKHPIFPMPEGRNSRLNLLDVSTLLLAAKLTDSDKSIPKDIVKDYFISTRDAYREYLSIVRGVSRRLWNDDDHIHDVEMLLFSLADTDVYGDVLKAVVSRGSSGADISAS